LHLAFGIQRHVAPTARGRFSWQNTPSCEFT
jgi:hypothetical protein